VLDAAGIRFGFGFAEKQYFAEKSLERPVAGINITSDLATGRGQAYLARRIPQH
jgi:hypothetical protein